MLKGPLRTRFAPSPTGFMHLGGLRTALFNYLAAKRSGGTFLLRIEDTDQSRSVPGSIEDIESVLKWTGIHPDANEPVWRQSARLGVYAGYAERLVEEGKAYRCYCTKERLEELRSRRAGGYDGACRNLLSSNPHRPHVIRLRAPSDHRASSFHDQVFGKVPINNADLDDAILIKSDTFPTYHFANVIDDHSARINLVMRGQEWLPSTSLHLLLYKALSWDPPAFAHLPLLVRPDGSKLSKRHGDAFVRFYRKAGWEPEALLNFVMFLGWSPSKLHSEVMSLDEMVQTFDVADVNRAESRVDLAKLDWFNKKHVDRLLETEPSRLVAQLRLSLQQEDISRFYSPRALEDAYLLGVVKLMSGRLCKPSDIAKLASYFFTRPNVISGNLLSATSKSLKMEIASRFASLLMETSQSEFKEALDKAILQLKQEFADHVSASKLMLTVRLAVTGTNVGASTIDTMLLLGRDESLARLECFSKNLV